MNHNGFLLIDSILALSIFTVIVLTLPGLIFILQNNEASLERLNTLREIYIASGRYDSPEDFTAAAKLIYKKAGIACEDRLKKICS